MNTDIFDSKVQDKKWLTLNQEVVQILSAINETLLLLSEKRVTLEEKILRRYLLQLYISYTNAVLYISNALREGVIPAEDIYEQLSAININVSKQISELLKALHYNLNYLEQYFEYDFVAKLTQEMRPAEAIDAVMADNKTHE